MACSLTITSVTGIAPVAGVPTAIRVEGTATECSQVNVTIRCTPGVAFGGTAGVTGGSWTVVVPTDPNSGCQCSRDIVVEAVCVSDPTCTAPPFARNLPCEGVCPTVAWSGLTIGDCTDGKRKVTISATVTAPGPCSAELRDGSATPLATVGPGAVGTLPLSGMGNYSGTVTFSVVITSPVGCTGISLPITVPDCFVCPTIAWDAPVFGPCTGNNRIVTVTAHLSSPSPTPFSAALSNAGVPLAGPTASSGGSLTLTGTGSYPGGSTQTFDVVITSPPMTCGGSSITVKVDDCCPSIMFSELIRDCVDGNRSVTVKADVSFPTAYSAELHDPHGHVDMFSGSGLHTLQLTDNYPGSSSQTFSVVITSPPGCPGKSDTVNVPSCDGGGNGFGLCAGLLVLAITLLVLGAALIIIGVCFSVGPLTTTGIITAALGLVLFVAWLLFCTHLTPCSVMRTLHCILFFLIAVVAPIIALLAFLFTGFSVCLLTVLGAWGGWGTIYAWLGVAMGSVGCTKTC